MYPPNYKWTMPIDSPSSLNYKRTAPINNAGLFGLPNCKPTAPTDCPSFFIPSNCKQTAPSNSFDFSSPPNHKQIVPSDSSSTTCTGIACTSKSPLPVKKLKHFNAFLVPNHIE